MIWFVVVLNYWCRMVFLWWELMLLLKMLMFLKVYFIIILRVKRIMFRLFWMFMIVFLSINLKNIYMNYFVYWWYVWKILLMMFVRGLKNIILFVVVWLEIWCRRFWGFFNFLLKCYRIFLRVGRYLLWFVCLMCYF